MTHFKKDPIPCDIFTVSTSEKRLAEIKKSVEELERTFLKTLRRSNINIGNSLEVDKEEFYSDLTSDQSTAADYFLNTMRSLDDSDQLLML